MPIEKDKDNAVPTTEFLEAAEEVVSIFGMCVDGFAGVYELTVGGKDVLGSVAFTPVKTDMNGNIKVERPFPV